MFSRRSFLYLSAAALASAREMSFDVAVIGGGLGGCAAALAALRNGMRVVLTEETDWLGGQSSSQAVPPDEHAWIEQFGGTRSWRAYREGIREYYRRHYPLTGEAASRWNLNPGGGTVSRITHEPRVTVAVLEQMLAPYASSGRLTILMRHKPVAADVDRDAVRSVSVTNLETGNRHTLHAKCFIDATEMGDVLPLTKTEYVTGAESRSDTGEEHAPAQAQPQNMQSFTWCFAIDHIEGEDHTIEKPAEYQFWRDYVPQLKPAWPGKLLAWHYSDPRTLNPKDLAFDPTLKYAGPALNLWLYRRMAAKANFTQGSYPSDITLVNWPMNDYWLGNLYEVPEAEAKKHWDRGKQLSLSLLYWMQTEAPRPDGGVGWKGLRLRRDIVGTEDGLAKYPYVRESRRIRAEFTIVEEHVSTKARRGSRIAQPYADSVGVGAYHLDLHPSSGGDNYIDMGSLPFQIPMGALLPLRVDNLLAGCKNLGVTHITNGCYRLHPVEWNIGESAGMIAAHSIRTGRKPRGIRSSARHMLEFQKTLTEQGIELAWPAFGAQG